MLENEINLIADKLGMTILQVYQMNLQYQHYVVIQNIATLIVCILTFTIFMVIGYYKYKTDSRNQNIIMVNTVGDWLLLFGLLGGTLATIVLGFSTFAIFNLIILPMQYPEYTAMLQTMHQIIPGCGC